MARSDDETDALLAGALGFVEVGSFVTLEVGAEVATLARLGGGIVRIRKWRRLGSWYSMVFGLERQREDEAICGSTNVGDADVVDASKIRMSILASASADSPMHVIIPTGR